MNFLTPAAFGLAVLLPIVVAMYLLKLRRTEQVVSSVYLWRRMVRDVEANAPWQRLQRNPLMFLQLLFLAVLILVLAQPFTWTEGASGQAVILIVDHSASMSARDAVPSRIEAAKSQARQLVDSMPDDARVTVIAASDNAQVLAASSLDRRQVYQAIESIQPGTGGSDMTTALGLASAIATRQPDTEVIVLSDGRVELPERLSIRGRVRYLPIGASGDNQAISLLSLEPGLGGNMTAFAQITNYGDEVANRRMELHVDGQLFNAYDLVIEPGNQAAVIADDLLPETEMVEARLQGEDVLLLDDRAWAVRSDSEPAPVTLVTAGNRFLETALSLLPGMEVSTITPEDFEQGAAVSADPAEDGPPGSSTTQLTIFDAYVPDAAPLPGGSILFIAPPQSSEYFTVTGVMEMPDLRVVEAGDPLVAHLSLAEVNVMDTVRIPLPPWARVIVAGDAAGDSTPLLFTGQPGGRRMAVLAFDLRRSDLPLQVAFPLLMANLTGWLAPGRSGGLPDQITPGSPVTLTFPPEVASVAITRPDRSRVQETVENGRVVFADTHQPGPYQVSWGESGRMGFAVNLFSPSESDVKPFQSLPVLEAGGAAESERPQQGRREWWRPLAFIALAFLVIEWLVYHRATLVRLWRNVRPAHIL